MSPSLVRESKRERATSPAAAACHEENTSRTAGLVTAAVGGGDWREERVAQESYSDGRPVDQAAAVSRFSAMEHWNECEMRKRSISIDLDWLCSLLNTLASQHHLHFEFIAINIH